jgi:hypothetical protein
MEIKLNNFQSSVQKISDRLTLKYSLLKGTEMDKINSGSYWRNSLLKKSKYSFEQIIKGKNLDDCRFDILDVENIEQFEDKITMAKHFYTKILLPKINHLILEKNELQKNKKDQKELDRIDEINYFINAMREMDGQICACLDILTNYDF